MQQAIIRDPTPVTEWLVKKGAEKIQTSAELQHTSQAIREAIFRQVRFNQALIAEVLEGKADDFAAFAKCIAEDSAGTLAQRPAAGRNRRTLCEMG